MRTRPCFIWQSLYDYRVRLFQSQSQAALLRCDWYAPQISNCNWYADPTMFYKADFIWLSRPVFPIAIASCLALMRLICSKNFRLRLICGPDHVLYGRVYMTIASSFHRNHKYLLTCSTLTPMWLVPLRSFRCDWSQSQLFVVMFRCLYILWCHS